MQPGGVEMVEEDMRIPCTWGNDKGLGRKRGQGECLFAELDSWLVNVKL